MILRHRYPFLKPTMLLHNPELFTPSRPQLEPQFLIASSTAICNITTWVAAVIRFSYCDERPSCLINLLRGSSKPLVETRRSVTCLQAARESAPGQTNLLSAIHGRSGRTILINNVMLTCKLGVGLFGGGRQNVSKPNLYSQISESTMQCW
jgi:hypothetical protein